MDALGDLKVVEVSRSVPGSYCGKLLADFGAEVIKVEAPGTGDEMRRAGPFRDNLPNPEGSGMYLYLNTNKLGITLNPHLPLGLKILKRLCEAADILILSMDAAEAEQLHYKEFTRDIPRLVVVLITPFGTTSPYKDYKASELTLSHVSGVAYFTPGNVNDPEKEPPLMIAERQTEFMSGMCAAAAAMLAISQREKTGLGQIIDNCSRDGIMLSNIWNMSALSYGGFQPVRTYGTAPFAPCHILPVKDGYIQVNCYEEEQWRQFVDLLGNPEWSKIDLFGDRFLRGKHWEALEPLLSATLQDWGKDVIAPAAQARGVPVTVVRSPAEMLESEQLAVRGYFTQIEHPVAGKVTYPGRPFLMSKTPWRHARLAPRLGEHNEEIFCQRLGYTPNDLMAMRASGIV